jgi:putative ABC transport system permease protein
MLFGRRGRYIAMVFGMSFAVMLITQQISIFMGVLERSTGALQNIGGVDLWVAAEHTTYIDMVRVISERHLQRLQSIPGVAWAKPFFSMRAIAETSHGSFVAVDLVGIDRTTLIGQPPTMLQGSLADLRGADAVIIEQSRRSELPGIGVGSTLRLNDREAKVVGVCRAKSGLLSRPQIFTTFENAARFSPTGRNRMCWTLVKLKPDADVQHVARDIERKLKLMAVTPQTLRWSTMKWTMTKTSIGKNFLITVILGSIVGLVISMATFNQFTSDNLPHFAVLKAIGTPQRVLIRMVVLQGAIAGLISYGIGVGLAALLSLPGRSPDAQLASQFSWPLLVVALVPMLACVLLGTFICLRRMMRVDPVVVFQ